MRDLSSRLSAILSASCLAAAAALLLLAPLALFAAPQPGEKEIKFRGQTIYVQGDPAVKYLPEGSDGNTPDAELVLSYTNCADSIVNALRTEQKFEARVLLVGGGGAGGYGTTNANGPGGGGGGGGEVIELGNKVTRRGKSAPFLFFIGTWKLICQRKTKWVKFWKRKTRRDDMIKRLVRILISSLLAVGLIYRAEAPGVTDIQHEESVNLTFLSPSAVDRREHIYGGVIAHANTHTHIDRWVEFMLYCGGFFRGWIP